MAVGFNRVNIMTQAEAEALVAGQKIQYWDGRIATVTIAATEVSPPPPPPEGTVLMGTYAHRDAKVGETGKKLTIIFDAEPEPRPIYRIWSYDFIRAAPVPL